MNNVNKDTQNNKKPNNKTKTKARFVKRAISLFAIISILSAIKQLPFKVNNEIIELANNNSDDNFMDDIFALDETIAIINPITNEQEEEQLETAVETLEKVVEINTIIDDLKIEEEDFVELSEEEKVNLLKFYEENGLETIISLYKDSNNTKIEKARIGRQLLFIKDYYGNAWLEANGISVSKNLLNRLIKSAAIETYGTFDIPEYNACKIPEERSFPYFNVTLEDSISGAKDNVFFTPILCGEYVEALLLTEDLNNMDDESKLTADEKLKYAKKTLNITRRCLNKKIKDFHGIKYTKKIEK